MDFKKLALASALAAAAPQTANADEVLSTRRSGVATSIGFQEDWTPGNESTSVTAAGGPEVSLIIPELANVGVRVGALLDGTLGLTHDYGDPTWEVGVLASLTPTIDLGNLQLSAGPIADWNAFASEDREIGVDNIQGGWTAELAVGNGRNGRNGIRVSWLPEGDNLSASYIVSTPF